MASAAHDFILGFVIRNMRQYGCELTYIENGKTSFIGVEGVSMPPRILRHRPDILGITLAGQICIGDAKTVNDLRSARTKEQLLDFTEIQLNEMPCEVFFGLPRSGKEQFKSVLKELGLCGYQMLHTIFVPDEIINE